MWNSIWVVKMRKIGLRCRQSCCSVSLWWFAWYGGSPQPMSALAACVPSGGKERCVQTHGAHRGGGTQSDLARLPVLRSVRRETSSGGCFWTERRRERKRPFGRIVSTRVAVESLGGSFFCLFLARRVFRLYCFCWTLMILDPLVGM